MVQGKQGKNKRLSKILRKTDDNRSTLRAESSRSGKTGAGKSRADSAVDGDSKFRPALPPRLQYAANDDLPSIGGLIFALQQKPSKMPFQVALIGSAVWLLAGSLLGWAMVAHQFPAGVSFDAVLKSPAALVIAAVIIVPIALFWFIAQLIARSQELKLMASAMSEVAIRLAEPDRAAEQSVASVGQTVRRQIAAMNDAIGRALGRAGELEALVHNEVSALERSYAENESKIRHLIDELASEREALSNNGDRIRETLQGIGVQVVSDIASRGEQIVSAVASAGTVIEDQLTRHGERVTKQLATQGAKTSQLLQETGREVSKEIPDLLKKLGKEQIKLDQVVKAATKNFSELEGALGARTTALETSLADKTSTLNTVLTDKFRAIDASLVHNTKALDATMSKRSESLDKTLQQHTGSLDKTLQQRSETLDKNLCMLFLITLLLFPINDCHRS